MDSVVKKILNSNSTSKQKIEKLDLLVKDVEFAKEVLAGKFKYCKECDDYYLTESFLSKDETIECRICTYSDPINSGGNEYADGYADISYEVCPKGHKHQINRIERLK